MATSSLKFTDAEMQVIDSALTLLKSRAEASGLLNAEYLGGAIERLAADYSIQRECHTCASSCNINCFSDCKGDCSGTCKGDCANINK